MGQSFWFINTLSGTSLRKTFHQQKRLLAGKGLPAHCHHQNNWVSHFTVPLILAGKGQSLQTDSIKPQPIKSQFKPKSVTSAYLQSYWPPGQNQLSFVTILSRKCNSYSVTLITGFHYCHTGYRQGQLADTSTWLVRSMMVPGLGYSDKCSHTNSYKHNDTN